MHSHARTGVRALRPEGAGCFAWPSDKWSSAQGTTSFTATERCVGRPRAPRPATSTTSVGVQGPSPMPVPRDAATPANLVGRQTRAVRPAPASARAPTGTPALPILRAPHRIAHVGHSKSCDAERPESSVHVGGNACRGWSRTHVRRSAGVPGRTKRGERNERSLLLLGPGVVDNPWSMRRGALMPTRARSGGRGLRGHDLLTRPISNDRY